LKKEKYADVLFFDEARFGTHTKLGYGWFKKGSRAITKIKIGYKSFYLYSAISACIGENVTLILPRVNTDCMNVYLKYLSEQYVGQKIALIMDGAGWHKSKGLEVPENIRIFLLPPYSPELNPVEQLWLHVKQNVLYNRLFETLEQLEEKVIDFLRTLQDHTVAQICANNYLDG